MKVRERLLNGKATAQDKLYSHEVQKRIIGVNDKLVSNDEHIPWKKQNNFNKGIVPENVETLWNNRSHYDDVSQTWGLLRELEKTLFFNPLTRKRSVVQAKTFTCISTLA